MSEFSIPINQHTIKLIGRPVPPEEHPILRREPKEALRRIRAWIAGLKPWNDPYECWILKQAGSTADRAQKLLSEGADVTAIEKELVQSISGVQAIQRYRESYLLEKARRRKCALRDASSDRWNEQRELWARAQQYVDIEAKLNPYQTKEELLRGAGKLVGLSWRTLEKRIKCPSLIRKFTRR